VSPEERDTVTVTFEDGLFSSLTPKVAVPPAGTVRLERLASILGMVASPGWRSGGG
jgi:hypothetical protein